MKKPITERQLYLLGYVAKNLITITDCGTVNSWRIIRGHSFYNHGSIRNPSQREGQALIDAGWIELAVDNSHWTECTTTGARQYHHRATLTADGTVILKASRTRK